MSRFHPGLAASVARSVSLLVLTAGAVAGSTACSTASSTASNDASAPPGATATLTLLHTSDLHTNLFPWDFYKDTADPTIGLSLVATRIKEERAKASCSLLIDSGDTIQGTPLGTYYALEDNKPTHPMAVAMNALGYDAMAVGNHEFNYGLDVLTKFKSEINFPLLAANVRKAGDGSPAFGEVVLKTVCGVRVAIVGLVTPGVPTWEKPSNIPGLVFENPIERAAKLVPSLRKDADVVVISIHSGTDRFPLLAPGQKFDDKATWDLWNADYNDASRWTERQNLPNENVAVQVGQIPGVDVVLSGHTHTPIAKMVIPATGAVLTQPSVAGKYLGKVTVDVAKTGGTWRITSKDATILPSEGAEEDAEIRALRTPYFDATRNFLNKPIGMTTGEFYGGMQARVVDSAVADLINEAQKWAAKKYASLDVDLSIAAIFLSNNGLPKGSLRLKDAFGIYNFDNTLYIVEMSGKTLREALEQNARYFGTLNGSALPESVDLCKANNPPVADYLWDLYSDIDYTLDVTREPGKRVTQLRYKGKDVVDGDTFKVAMNNYRAGGGGFPQFAGLKLLWQGADGIRDYVAQFIEEKSAAAGGSGTGPVGLDPNTINVCNFTLVPNIYSKYFPSMPVKCSP